LRVALKILKQMSSEVVRQREQRAVYFTNRKLKAYTLFVWLKNMTESGYIHNYEDQGVEICSALKISRASYYNYLREAETLQLLKRRNGRIELAGWEKVVEAFSLPEKSFTTIYYDVNNPKEKLSIIIEALEFVENKEKQQLAVTSKIAKNPKVKAAFELYCQLHGLKAEFNEQNLAYVRMRIFQKGSAESIYEALMNTVNPEFYRNSLTIAAAHGYKSPKSATYLKRKLQKAGIAYISKGNKSVCSYSKNRIEGVERGKNENGTLYYQVKEKVKVWYQPDKVTISEFLFSAPPKNQS